MMRFVCFTLWSLVIEVATLRLVQTMGKLPVYRCDWSVWVHFGCRCCGRQESDLIVTQTKYLINIVPHHIH